MGCHKLTFSFLLSFLTFGWKTTNISAEASDGMFSKGHLGLFAQTLEKLRAADAKFGEDHTVEYLSQMLNRANKKGICNCSSGECASEVEILMASQKSWLTGGCIEKTKRVKREAAKPKSSLQEAFLTQVIKHFSAQTVTIVVHSSDLPGNPEYFL